MKKIPCVITSLLLPCILFCQRIDTIVTEHHKPDTLVETFQGIPVSLGEVVVEAFHSNRQWKAVPAAVAVLGSQEINRYPNTTFVPLFNLVPGVRVEERSPASYRLSIRGSLLRSPFGVRNVKVYWNEIPLTDGGGNTYLNLVDLNELTSAEIIKGPAASTYGAGTGGAVLLQSYPDLNDTAKNRYTVGISGGSFGLFQYQLGWKYNTKKFSSSLQNIHQQSDGYREQSATRKDILKWQGTLTLEKHQLQFLAFYTDLYYQTPGGINLAQFQSNPKLARQTAGTIPGSVQQQAAIYNKTIFGGVHDEWNLGDHFSLKSFVTANHTAFTNPFITNYEKRDESNAGAGTSLVYHTKNANTDFQWINGAEWLYNHSLINDFGNRNGVMDTVQFKDDIYAKQWFAFSQAQLGMGERWVFTAGLSFNNQSFRYKRLTDAGAAFVAKKINGVFTPRVAALYRINKDVSLYALAAKGFSPPAVAEVRPSDGNYYGDLAAEYGWNYEAGIKGELFAGKLRFDVAAYFFNLQNAIVRRTNAAGAEYFVNAGGTKQNGIEGLLKYFLLRNSRHFISGLHLWSSYSYQPYRFKEYQQAGVNYSGNELTGVPRNIWVSGVDVDTKNGFYLNASINATSSLPLTDANDAYADAYRLVQCKTGFRNKKIDVFAGIDNLLNQHYSLGNDINALGKRYYNAAQGRNVSGGIIYRF
jgi:iron complex outermembrane receptor protein